MLQIMDYLFENAEYKSAPSRAVISAIAAITIMSIRHFSVTSSLSISPKSKKKAARSASKIPGAYL